MHIPTHQIHNLLNAYTKRLKEKQSQDESGCADTSEIKNTQSASKKRQSLINKITADIFDRISRSGLRRKTDMAQDNFPKTINPKDIGSSEGLSQTRFTYNRVDANGEKITMSVEIQNSDFLIKQMDQAARSPSEK